MKRRHFLIMSGLGAVTMAGQGWAKENRFSADREQPGKKPPFKVLYSNDIRGNADEGEKGKPVKLNYLDLTLPD